MTIRVSLCVLLSLCVMCIGCDPKGPDVQKVKGLVTLDGAPLDGAMITFFPAGEGEMGYSSTDEKGYYELSMLGAPSQGGVLVGEYSVAFSKQVADPSFKRPTRNSPEEDVEEVDVPFLELVPRKYTSASTSGFTVSVKQGVNVLDFELDSK